MWPLPAEPISEVRVSRPRPYWHVDAKWIAGVLLLPVVSAALLISIVVQLTSEQVAVPLMSTVVAAMFSPVGLDDPGDIEIVRKQIREQKLDRVAPLPGLNIYMTASDVERLTPRELRIGIFRQLLEPVYREGPSGVRSIAADPAKIGELEKDLGLLGIVNQSLHLKLKRILNYIWAAAAVLAALLIYFSAGFGRLVSPGVVMLLACLPGALLVPLALNGGGMADAPLHPSAGGSMVSILAAYALPAVVPVVTGTYRWALSSALLLFGLAIMGRLTSAVLRWARRRKSGCEVT